MFSGEETKVVLVDCALTRPTTAAAVKNLEKCMMRGVGGGRCWLLKRSRSAK